MDHDCLVDARALEETCEHAASPSSIDVDGHERVLLTNASLELVIDEWIGPEDAQVDIDDERVIGIHRSMVVCRLDVLGDTVQSRRGYAHGAEQVKRESRAGLLVVGPTGMVHGIVKPQRELDLCGPLGRACHPVEPGQTSIHMLERVVVPMRLAVPSCEIREEHIGFALTADRVQCSSEPCSKLGVSALSLSNSHGPSLVLVNWLHNQDMGRPSNRAERRQEILNAFARVLADHGYAGATIAAVATEAEMAPGLIHHHFDSKGELLRCLLAELSSRFRKRIAHYEQAGDPLLAYVDAAIKLDGHADITAAKCWVSLFAEALRDAALFDQTRRLIDTEIVAIERRSGQALDAHEAGAVLAYVIGALVLGAFAPRKTSGFAAPGLHKLVAALRK